MDGPRRVNRAEAGFTITELMVTSMILLVIVTVAMTLLVAGQRATSFSTRRGQTQDDVRLAMDRLTKDLRQATRFQTSFTTDPWSGRDLTFWTYTVASPDTPVQVRWWVSGTTLNRREGTAGATIAVLGAITPAGGTIPDLFRCDVDGSDPTTGAPVPSRITVTLTVDLTDPGTTYSTETQVQLRNLDVAAP